MRRLTLTAAILVVGTMGCDNIPFLGGGDEESATPEQPAAVDTAQAGIRVFR